MDSSSNLPPKQQSDNVLPHLDKLSLRPSIPIRTSTSSLPPIKMPQLTEDDRYRTSTQYRLWSFTPSSLLSLRTTTNALAATRVRDAVQRIRESRAATYSSGNNTPSGAATPGGGGDSRSTSAIPQEGEIDCLTVEEELKLLRYYCKQTAQLSDHLKMPKDVKATAIQYLLRFYTTNSLMTYTPTTLLKTALFFSTKTENHYTSLSKFSTSVGKTSPEDVLASEFLLTQGLRFTFDVRHPYRALEGAYMELLSLTKTPPLSDFSIPSNQDSEGGKQKSNEEKITNTYLRAKDYLKTSSLLTDVYFHYTPSQIMFSSLYLVDAPLTTWYITSKFPPTTSQSAPLPILQKILNAIKNCAEMMAAVTPSMEISPEEKKETQILMKKLKKCQNPEKMDLVALQRVKREGADDKVDEKVIKKRKMEREKSEQEGNDLFGPAIVKN